MKVYARKLFQHDMTHEVSILHSIVEEFFQIEPGKKDQLVFIGKNSQQKFKVTINTPDDPRFGNEFKKLLSVESGNSISIDDVFLVYKHASSYSLEYIKKTDERYNTIFNMFEKKDRHLVFYAEDDNENSNIEKKEPDDLRKSFEKYLREVKGLVQWERQAREIDNWSQKLFDKGIISKKIYSVSDYDEYKKIEAAIRDSDDYKAYKQDRKEKNPSSGLPSDQGLTNYGEFLLSLNNSEKDLKDCLHVSRSERTNKLFPLNFIIYGAPGTGKTYSTAEYALAIIENRDVDLSRKTPAERKSVMSKYKSFIRNGQIVFTTFHQNYGYEEFIQGLRPDTESERMSFKTVDGIFKHVADIALNDDENNYVIIIDEINRANISKVFGELITLIEEDKRWGEVNETCATLQSGDVFAVPNNLYIVGTMNSADKSISLIDAALRRRFEFVEQKPNPELVDDPTMKNVLKKMNAKLADELDSTDLLIGHSYFMNKNSENIASVLNNSIIPLLYEYFYDNKKKVASVLDFVLEDDINVEIMDDKLGRLSVRKKDDQNHGDK